MASYATRAELRAAPYSVPSSEADDATADAILEVASRVVDNFTHRTFDSAASTKTFNDFYGRVLTLPVPFATVTSVTVEGAATTEYKVEPWGILFNYTQSGDVAVTATFGYSTVPVEVKRATLLVAAAMVRGGSAIESDEEVQSQSAEGYSVSYQTQQAETSKATTGVEEADRLLEPKRLPFIG